MVHHTVKATSVSPASCKKRKERRARRSVSFKAFCDTRKRTEPHPQTGSMWLTTGAELRHDGYTSQYKAKNGQDSDPLSEPFDPEVAVLAGEGRKNGHLWIGDGSVDPSTIPSLRNVRASRTSSNAGIETRPKPSMVAFSEIQARLNEETRKREEAELREQQVQATLAQQQEMLARQHEFMAAISLQVQALQAGTSGAPPLAPLPPLPPLNFVLFPSSAGSNNVPLALLHKSPVTPNTASQPMPDPHTSTIRRAL